MAMLVEHRGRKGPIRGPDRVPAPRAIDEMAEEMINGLFCHYEAPNTMPTMQKTRGILRPPNSFQQRTQTNESSKSVRWIDDNDEAIMPDGSPRQRSDLSNNKSKSQKNGKKGRKGGGGGPMEINLGNLTNSCMDAGIEAGCMSPNTTKSSSKNDGSIPPSMSHDSSVASSSLLLHPRETRAQRYAVFDEDGNPVRTKAGMQAPPKPPPTPPPNRNEVFIPQLCGVQLNCIDEDEDYAGSLEDGSPNNDTMIKASSSSKYSPIHRNTEEGDDDDDDAQEDNSVVDEDGGDESIPPPPVALKKTASSNNLEGVTSNQTAKAQKQAASPWQQLRSRLGADSEEDDWDGPDWMESQKTGNDPAAQDPVARDRSEAGVSNVQEEEDDDDWDSSLPVVPAASKNQPANNRSTSKTDDKDESNALSAGNDDKKDQKKRVTLFGRRRSIGRDPSPGRSRLRLSSGRDSDVTGNFSDALGKFEPKQSSSSEDVLTVEPEDTKASLKEKFRRNSRSRSKSPGRRFSQAGKKILEGITTFSPTRENETDANNRGFESNENNNVDSSHNAPMPHLHPAHPLNQVRRKLQDRDETADRQSFIGAHRRNFDKTSQVPSEHDDRMSFITAHRQQIGDSERNQTPSDQDDRMSFISAHRKYVGDDQRSQVMVDQDSDDRMSYITAHRAQIDGVPPPPPPPPPPQTQKTASGSTVDENMDKQSYIGAYRDMMDSPKKTRVSSPRRFLRRFSSSKSPAKQRATEKQTSSSSSSDKQAEPPKQEVAKPIEEKDTVTESNDDDKPKDLPSKLSDSSSEDNIETVIDVANEEGTKTKTEKEEAKKTEEEGKKKKEEEEVSWEERTRLAWERIRNGFGVSSDESKEKKTEVKTKSEEEKDTSSQTVDSGSPASGSQSVSNDKPETSTKSETPTDEAPANSKDKDSTNPDSQTTVPSPVVDAKVPESNASSGLSFLPSFMVGSSTATDSVQDESQPLKGILKTPPAEKKVTFMESLEKMFTSSPTVDENNTTPPPEDDGNENSQGPIDMDTVSVDTSVKTEDAESNIQPALPEDDQPKDTSQHQPASPTQPKKKKRVFRGRKLFSGIRGKGKNKASASNLPLQDKVNTQAPSRETSLPVENPKPQQEIVPQATAETQQSFEDQNEPPIPQSSPAGAAPSLGQGFLTVQGASKVEQSQHPSLQTQQPNSVPHSETVLMHQAIAPVAQPNGNSSQFQLPIQQPIPQPNIAPMVHSQQSPSNTGFVHTGQQFVPTAAQNSLPYNHQGNYGFIPPVESQRIPNGFPHVQGSMVDPTGQHMGPAATGEVEKNDSRRSRFSLRGRGRSRSQSPGRRGRSQSPLRNTSTAERDVASHAPSLNYPQPVLHPYQQGYIYSHQPYAYMNSAGVAGQTYAPAGQPVYPYQNPAHGGIDTPSIQPQSGYPQQYPQQQPVLFSNSSGQYQPPNFPPHSPGGQVQNLPLQSPGGQVQGTGETQPTEPKGMLASISGMF